VITLSANNFDILNIKEELDLKVGGIKELSSKIVMEEFSKAVFTVGAKAFVKAINLEAKSNPKRYHHIYEWNKAGVNTQRLFFLYNDSFVGGVLTIRPGFMQSRTPVPIAPELLVPGKTGRVVAARNVFKDKASVMENGTPITYRASKPLPIADGSKINFIARGTLVRINNPGGTEVKGSFENFFHFWFASKLQSVVDASGMVQAIDKETASVLNKKGAGPAQVRTAIINVLRQYSKGEEVV
jgi:hypothetical protein